MEKDGKKRKAVGGEDEHKVRREEREREEAAKRTSKNLTSLP